MIHCGDLFDVLPTLPADSIDACVTDPPYGIGFMGKEWDTFKPSNIDALIRLHDRKTTTAPAGSSGRGVTSPSASASMVAGKNYDDSAEGLRRFQQWTEQWAREVFRVLKPGAYIVVCCAPRSYHRMACGLEDAGFVIRDKFSWLFGSGFPKNLNLGDGRGTALKPAHEPIALAWKPFKGSITKNVEKHGTGALNIDACRIGSELRPNIVGTAKNGAFKGEFRQGSHAEGDTDQGRWPANVVMDEEAAAVLDASVAPSVSRIGKPRGAAAGAGWGMTATGAEYDDEGGPSRFYYVAKPSREERDMGCYDLQPRQRDDSRKEGNPGGDNPRNRGLQPRGNYHPTVKPVELMRWLVRLVTPINGVVLDPFGGSFTTAMACVYENRRFVIIEKEAEYVEIGVRRVRAVSPLLIDPDALEVRRVVSARSPLDAQADAAPDPAAQDSTASRSACPDPCDVEAATEAAGRE